MALPRTTLRLALKISREMEAAHQGYIEECESWARQGYRPQYCEHGTNQWTDYDAICAGCEEGISFGDPRQRREHALEIAKHQCAQALRLLQIMNELNTEFNIQISEQAMPVLLKLHGLTTTTPLAHTSRTATHRTGAVMYEDDEDREILLLASERNPDLGFSLSEDSGYDRDYPRAEDY